MALSAEMRCSPVRHTQRNTTFTNPTPVGNNSFPDSWRTDAHNDADNDADNPERGTTMSCPRFWARCSRKRCSRMGS